MTFHVQYTQLHYDKFIFIHQAVLIKFFLIMLQHLTPARPRVVVTLGEVGWGGPFLHACALAGEVT